MNPHANLTQILATEIDHPLAEDGTAVTIRCGSTIHRHWQAAISAEVARLACELFHCGWREFLVADRGGVDMDGRNGIGIKNDELEKGLIFKDGYQGELTHGENRTGPGKGLTFVKRVIDRHKGLGVLY